MATVWWVWKRKGRHENPMFQLFKTKGMKMYSMEDAVLDHSRQVGGASSTGQALKLLGLKDAPENYGAGNLYLTALKLIRKFNKPKRRIEVE